MNHLPLLMVGIAGLVTLPRTVANLVTGVQQRAYAPAARGWTCHVCGRVNNNNSSVCANGC